MKLVVEDMTPALPYDNDAEKSSDDVTDENDDVTDENNDDDHTGFPYDNDAEKNSDDVADESDDVDDENDDVDEDDDEELIYHYIVYDQDPNNDEQNTEFYASDEIPDEVIEKIIADDHEDY